MKLAYAAGFLDGEGCIRINKRNPRFGRSINYSLLVTVVQKDARPVDWFAGNFRGGTVYLKNKQKDNWIYEWRITDRMAYLFLKEVEPFLRVKREQARLAIRFQERRNFARSRNTPDNGRYLSLSEHEIHLREEMYQQMRRLKKQYVKSAHPNVREYSFPSMIAGVETK